MNRNWIVMREGLRYVVVQVVGLGYEYARSRGAVVRFFLQSKAQDYANSLNSPRREWSDTLARINSDEPAQSFSDGIVLGALISGSQDTSPSFSAGGGDFSGGGASGSWDRGSSSSADFSNVDSGSSSCDSGSSGGD